MLKVFSQVLIFIDPLQIHIIELHAQNITAGIIQLCYAECKGTDLLFSQDPLYW